jgi:transposase
MATATTQTQRPTAAIGVLYMSFELGERDWKLAFTTGLAQRPRLRAVKARQLEKVAGEILAAKRRFGLSADAPVVSCYEAGRDGAWLHRALLARGIRNYVVDAASIEVNRRARRAKADRLDAEKLALMLVRYDQGDRRTWHVVHVLADGEEDARQLQRELRATVEDRGRLTNRIGGLLATQGLTLRLTGDVPAALRALRRWDGTPLPPALLARLEREWAMVEVVQARIRALKRQRRHEIAHGTDAASAQMRELVDLRGVGDAFATTLVREAFGPRVFRNRREVGGLAGLTPTPYQSGDSHHEQGISKAGNRYLRHMAVELAWCWLRYQPQSELSQWYRRRFADRGPAAPRIGIVAVARKLLIALWRYLRDGVPPAGALRKDGPAGRAAANAGAANAGAATAGAATAGAAMAA